MRLPEKIPLLTQPTPLQYLPSLSQRLGIQLYLKRDDLTDPGLGGNKLRKLQYLLADALAQGATTLLTMGGAQSNHSRQTAAVAARYGLRCAVVCVEEYPGELSANLLVDRLLGAEVVFKKPDGRPMQTLLTQGVAQVQARYEAQGERVYVIPMGGSSAIGAAGYVDCAQELTVQATRRGLGEGRVICPVGTLGTYMGLFAGLREEGASLSVTGIAIAPFGADLPRRVMDYWQEVKTVCRLSRGAAWEEFSIETAYDRGGYDLPDGRVREAIYEMARREGILLDPCYTGKCFAGMLDMLAEGKIAKGETVILLHTGGVPGLFAREHRLAFERELIGGVTALG